jgi:hypothetical protein
MKKEEQKQHLIDMMRDDENLGLYENWVEDAEKESSLSDLNSKANIFWSGYRVGVKSKQETQETTLEEKAEEYEYTDGIYGFKAGAKWQAKRMYTEEEVKQIIEATLIEHSDFVLADIPKWYEQFKKK